MKNMLNIERLAVEDFLGLEKEEIGTLSSQLNKALLDSQKRLGMTITPRGDLRGDFLYLERGEDDRSLTLFFFMLYLIS